MHRTAVSTAISLIRASLIDRPTNSYEYVGSAYVHNTDRLNTTNRIYPSAYLKVYPSGLPDIQRNPHMTQTSAGTIPSYQEVLLEWPLYREIKLNTNRLANWYGDLRDGEVAFDSYCTECRSRTPFKAARPTHMPASWHSLPVSDTQFTTYMKCQRLGHTYNFVFLVANGVLTKIGQWPSMEDIAYADIEKYRSILGKQYFSELHRAGGLASHGIGIGAFVYLRRIFERLIFQHREEYDPGGTQIPNFATLRMDEKIEKLRSVLPAAVVRNKAAYAILSKGLHELSEDD